VPTPHARYYIVRNNLKADFDFNEQVSLEQLSAV
jgi:hypothetical protein